MASSENSPFLILGLIGVRTLQKKPVLNWRQSANYQLGLLGKGKKVEEEENRKG
jgi:hypothetical protein